METDINMNLRIRYISAMWCYPGHEPQGKRIAYTRQKWSKLLTPGTSKAKHHGMSAV